MTFENYQLLVGSLAISAGIGMTGKAALYAHRGTWHAQGRPIAWMAGAMFCLSAVPLLGARYWPVSFLAIVCIWLAAATTTRRA